VSKKLRETTMNTMNSITKDYSNESNMPLAKQSNSLGFTLTADQQMEVDQIVSGIKIEELTPADIVQIGFPAEKALQQILDGFLARLDKNASHQVFQLFEQLEKGVKDANLQEVLNKIQDTQPTFFRKLMGYLKGKSLSQITRETFEGIKDVLSGKTQTLAYEVNKIEKELFHHMQRLNDELRTMEALKDSYHLHMHNFGTMAVASQHILEKAKAHLLVLENESRSNENPILIAQLQDFQQKVQLLESRTLSLVGAFTRLPADHIIIQQIEQAGVATLQETTITASSRFASIKTTLLAINGAFNVKNVQHMAQKQAVMDQQLQQIRSQLTKEIVTTAIASPGDNRLEQVAQIEKIIQDAKDIRELIKTAQEVNDSKFRTARDKFEMLRNQLSQN
jgi:hypothetical protein